MYRIQQYINSLKVINMAIGDKKVLVTQTYVDSTFDRKDNITDDTNTYDSTKNASAKAVADLGDRIEALEAGGGGGNAITQTKKTYTATAGQTTFSAPYNIGYVDVYLNGIKLSEADFTGTNGTSIILAVGCEAGDVVQISGYNTVTTGGGGSGVSGGTLDESGNVIETSSLENQMALTVQKYMKAYQQGGSASGAKAVVGLNAVSDNNTAEVELKATSGNVDKTLISMYAKNIKMSGLTTSAPAASNMIYNSGGILQVTGSVSVPSPTNGQVLMYNEALGVYVPASPDANAPQAEVFKAKRYIEVVAVHKSMNVLNMDAVINGIYNLYQGNIINIVAYTTTGTCNVQLMIDGVASSDVINVNNAKNITAANIPVIKDTVFTFKTTGADVNTKGLVLFLEIEETVSEKQTLITRYIQCPAVHKLESLLNTDSVINSIFCPYKGLLTKISAFTNTGTCTITTKHNGVDILTQNVTNVRTSQEISRQVLRLDQFDFAVSAANGTGLVIILTIEEM